MNNELYHIGTPRHSGRYPWGSGKRPHQSLEKSKRKSVSDMSDQELIDYNRRKNLENQYKKLSKSDSEKLEKTRNAVNETSNALNRAANTMRSDNNQKTWERMDLSKMTDQELRDKINRENLEIQYSKLFNQITPEVSKGKEYVQQIFDTGADVLAVTGSALSIALAIKALKAVV